MGGTIFLLALLLLVGIIRAQSALIMLSSLLMVTIVAFAFWSRHAARGLQYRRFFDPPRIFPGEQTDYVVEISNRKLLPLPWVSVEERVPSAVEPARGARPSTGAPAARPGEMLASALETQGSRRVSEDEGWVRRRTVSLGWHERLELRQRFTCAQRGDYVVGPTDIETGDPLGLFPVQLRIPETHALVVYPRLAALPPLDIRSRSPLGPISARPPALEDPMRFAGIRDYRPGDPRRFIDWKASARRMKLQTRVYTPSTLNNVVIALNVQTMPFSWQGYDPQKLESAISVTAALLSDALAARQPVGLAANTSGPGMEDFQVFLRPNRRPSQLEDALGVLAKLSPLPTMAFGPFLERVAANFPYGASLVVVTAFLNQEIADYLSAMAQRGHGISLVYLGVALPNQLDPRIAEWGMRNGEWGMRNAD